MGVERREDGGRRAEERGDGGGGGEGGVEMTGSGAVIHLLTAGATAENRSNPLV